MSESMQDLPAENEQKSESLFILAQSVDPNTPYKFDEGIEIKD